MVKTNITLSVDSEIRDIAWEILDKRGVKFSSYIQSCLKKLIEKEGNKSGLGKEKI